MAVISSSLAVSLPCRNHGHSHCNGSAQRSHVECQTRQRVSLAPEFGSDGSEIQVEICAVSQSFELTGALLRVHFCS